MSEKKTNKVEQIKQDKDGLDVLKDLMRYSEQGDFDAIDKDDLAQRFKWFGVYQQKPNVGHFMLRIKIPGGQLTPAQLRQIATISHDFGRDLADITTRQTIQLHWLTIADMRSIFQRLADVGLNSQFACGDAPRNVTSCPLAGVLKDEIIDATADVRAVSARFEACGHAVSNLPRKFKSALAGCPIHCHEPQINCQGFFGVRRDDGSTGYGLLLGGGLSSTPHYGQSLRVFIKPEQVPDVAEAVAVLFRDHGYREKRTRARLKFLVADKGWQWCRDRLEEILGYRLEHDPGITDPPAQHLDHMGVSEQKDGNFALGLPVRRGRFDAPTMHALADLAEHFGVGEQRIRLTNKQNLLLLDIPPQNVDPLVKQLEDLGLPPVAHPLRDTLVACTGSEFCNLAIVETKALAARVLAYLEDRLTLDEPMMISFSGCPNSCAQYQIADIGLTGQLANDPDGRTDEKGKPVKVDAYNVLLGGRVGADPRFGEVVAKKVVADRLHLAIENLVRTYQSERGGDGDSFHAWVGRNEPERLEKLIVEPTTAPDAQPLTA